MTKIKNLISLLEDWAPLPLQESYDNSGLQTGDIQTEVTGVLVTLDCTLAVLNEALQAGCNVIIAHHPVIFKPLKQLTGRNEVEQIIIQAIRHNLAIYACHTNLDNILTGVNAQIGKKLGLEKLKILQPKAGNILKLITFAPLNYSEKILAALYAAGAGQIGAYKNCSFRVAGIGSFMPSAGTTPYLGQPDQQEEVAENRLEVILPDYLKEKVLKALRQNHPYEEVAYDLYQLTNTNQDTGSGMIGFLAQPLLPLEFIAYLKEKMELNIIKHTILNEKKIEKIAVCGGAGSFLIKEAMRQEADIYITADLKYHEFFIPENKMILADIGHYESEVYTKEIFYEKIRKKFTNFAVLKSTVNTNPVRYT